MPSPKLNEMLAEYRRLKAASPSRACYSTSETESAIAIADYLLTLDASDLDERDRTFPRPAILPTRDLPRRAEDIRARAGD